MQRSIAKARPRSKRKVPEARAATPASAAAVQDVSEEMTACAQFKQKHPQELKDWSALRCVVRLAYRGASYEGTMCLFYPPEAYTAGPSYHKSEAAPESGAREFFKWGVLVESESLPVSVSRSHVRRWSLGFCELEDGSFEFAQALDDAPVTQELDVYLQEIIYIRPFSGRRAARARVPTDHIRDVIRKKVVQKGSLPDTFPVRSRFAVLRSVATQEAHRRARSGKLDDEAFDATLVEIMKAPTPWDEAPDTDRHELEAAVNQLAQLSDEYAVEFHKTQHVVVHEGMPDKTDDKTSVWRALYQSQESASIPTAHQERPCIVTSHRGTVRSFVMWKVL